MGCEASLSAVADDKLSGKSMSDVEVDKDDVASPSYRHEPIESRSTVHNTMYVR